MNATLPPLLLRELPEDLRRRKLEQLVQEGSEDLCGRLYERCLLLLGSGQCPPDDPIWEQACRRFGVLQKGEGLETWQATFRAFCKEVARLPPKIRAVVWKYVRGDGAAVPHEDFEILLNIFTRIAAAGRVGWGTWYPLVYEALKHFGVRDPETAEFLRAWYGNDDGDSVEAMLQLIDGHPRQGAHAIVRAIRSPGGDIAQRLLPALLAAGVPTETLVRDRETLLHYAVRMRNAYAVAQLLQAGADQTARNAEGWTAAEMAMKKFINDHHAGLMGGGLAWANDGWDDPEMQQILQLLWPEAAAEWRAMNGVERHAAVRDGWSPVHL